MSEKIPVTPKQPANQLPIKKRHINSIAQVHGLDTALEVAMMQKIYNSEGGVNPNAVEAVFPDGSSGDIDEAQLFKCLGNFRAWST